MVFSSSKKFFILFFVLCFLFFLLFSCEKKDEVENNSSDIYIDIVLPSSKFYSVYLPGEKIQFKASIKSLKNIVIDDPCIVWESSVGNISENGEYITPNEPCTVSITARFNDIFTTVNIKIEKEENILNDSNFYFLKDSVLQYPSSLNVNDSSRFWHFGNSVEMEAKQRATFVDGGGNIRYKHTDGTTRTGYISNVSRRYEYFTEFFGTTENPVNFQSIKDIASFEGLECFQMKVPRFNIIDEDHYFNWAWISLMFSITSWEGKKDLLLANNAFLLDNYNKLHFSYKVEEKFLHQVFRQGERTDEIQENMLLQVEMKARFFSVSGYRTKKIFSFRFPLNNIPDGEWVEKTVEFTKPNVNDGEMVVFDVLAFTLLTSAGTFNAGTLYLDDIYLAKDETKTI